MARMTLTHYLISEGFSTNDFDGIAENLAQVFRDNPNIQSYNFLGIDPHPQENGTTMTYFEYEVIVNEQA